MGYQSYSEPTLIKDNTDVIFEDVTDIEEIKTVEDTENRENELVGEYYEESQKNDERIGFLKKIKKKYSEFFE